MTDGENKIPIGDGMFINMGEATIGHYALSEDSHFAVACHEHCNPDGLVSFYGQRSVAEFCMMNAMQVGGRQEMILDIDVQCLGPKKKLFRRAQCGAQVSVSQVTKPLDE